LFIDEQRATVHVEGLPAFTASMPLHREWAINGMEILMSLRPEKIDISKAPMAGFANHVRGIIKTIVYHGSSTRYNVELDNGMMLRVFEQNEEHFPQEVIDYDDEVNLYWQKRKCSFAGTVTMKKMA